MAECVVRKCSREMLTKIIIKKKDKPIRGQESKRKS